MSRLPEELRQLCEPASKEMNPEKLFALVAEIDVLGMEAGKAKKIQMMQQGFYFCFIALVMNMQQQPGGRH